MSKRRDNVFIRTEGTKTGTSVSLVAEDGTMTDIEQVMSVRVEHEAGRPPRADIAVLAAGAFQFRETDVTVRVEGETDVAEARRQALLDMRGFLSLEFTSKADALDWIDERLDSTDVS